MSIASINHFSTTLNRVKRQSPFTTDKFHIDFEEAFDHIGHFGPYQLCLFFLIGIATFIVGIQMIASTFLSADMEHWCHIPRLQNFSHSQQKYIAIPLTSSDDTVYSSCMYYDLPWSEYTDQELIEWNRTARVEDAETVSCDKWVYDQTNFDSTIINEWDLVCENEWQVPMTTSISLSGVMMGAFLFGYLSDRFGRMPAFAFGNGMAALAGSLCSLSPNIIVYNILRWLTISGMQGGMIAGFVMVTETFGPRHRTWGGIVFSIFYSGGFTVLAGIAYMIRDHEKLQIVMVAVNGLSVLTYWILPESPRWLLTKGKEEEAMEVIKYIGRVNNREFPGHLMVVIKGTSTDQKRAKFSELFSHPVLRRITLIMFFVWFTSSLSYYATSINLGSMTGDIFLNIFIAGALEFPANTLCFILLMRVGRRWPLAAGMMLGGVCLVATTPFYDTDYEFMVIVLTMFGKAGFTSTFTGIFVFTAEVIPTPVRNIGVGACSMMASIGSISSPYFGAPLQAIWTPLPSDIIGALAIVGGLLLLLLPETLNRKMPDTIEDTVRICRKKSLLLPSIYEDMAEGDEEDTDSVSEQQSNISYIDTSSKVGIDNQSYVADNISYVTHVSTVPEKLSNFVDNVSYVIDTKPTDSSNPHDEYKL